MQDPGPVHPQAGECPPPEKKRCVDANACPADSLGPAPVSDSASSAFGDVTATHCVDMAVVPVAAEMPKIPDIEPFSAVSQAYYKRYCRLAMVEHGLQDATTAVRSVESLATLCSSVRTELAPSMLLSHAIVHVDPQAAAARPERHSVREFPGSGSTPAVGLNESQLQAATLGAKSSMGLVEGPPGTGKTKVACAILSWWIRNLRPSLRCEFCALHAIGTSNAAVDNLAISLASLGHNVVRLGSRKAFTRSTVQDLMPKKHQMAEKLMKADVVCTTAQGCRHPALVEHNVKLLKTLFDEAGQSTEPNTVVAICGGTDQVVLVGDTRQLPATVRSEEARRLGMSCSMFERLVEKGLVSVCLGTQY